MLAWGRGRWAVSQKVKLIHKFLDKNMFIHSCGFIENGTRFETLMDKIRFHGPKRQKKPYHLWYTCTYIAYKGYNPRVSETLLDQYNFEYQILNLKQ